MCVCVCARAHAHEQLLGFWSTRGGYNLVPINSNWDFQQILSLSVVVAAFNLFQSMPQPVKFPGWKMHGRACKQYTFRNL